MKRTNTAKHLFYAALYALALSVSINTYAAASDSGDAPRNSSKKAVRTLIMTSDRATPMRLAAITVEETRSLLVILPPPANPGGAVRIRIPDGKPDIEIKPDDLSGYISYIDPGKVIVIGGPETVHPGFLRAVENKYPLYEIKYDNWELNATAIGNLLTAPAIPRRYVEETRRMILDNAAGAGKKNKKISTAAPIKNEQKTTSGKASE